jgi:hypothetical protein
MYSMLVIRCLFGSSTCRMHLQTCVYIQYTINPLCIYNKRRYKYLVACDSTQEVVVRVYNGNSKCYVDAA